MQALPYVLLLIISLTFSELNIKNSYPLRMVALLLIILFVGLRYDVGADYLSYEKLYATAQNHVVQDFLVEPGYFLLNKIVYFFHGKFFVLTTLIITIQLYFVHQSIKNFKYYTFALFVFITMNLGSLVNEMRQYVAVAIFLYATHFIIQRSFVKYLLLILLASCFHYSAILTLPLYFLLRIKFNHLLYPLTFVAAVIISKLGIFDSLFARLIDYTPYAFYLEMEDAEQVATSSGFGFLFKNLLGLLILSCYKPLFKKYPEYKCFLNLFFLFLICRNLFFNIGILMRLTLYFQMAEVFIYPLFIYGIFQRKIVTDMALVLSGLLLLLYIIGIMNLNNHLTYQTIWG